MDTFTRHKGLAEMSLAKAVSPGVKETVYSKCKKASVSTNC